VLFVEPQEATFPVTCYTFVVPIASRWAQLWWLSPDPGGVVITGRLTGPVFPLLLGVVVGPTLLLLVTIVGGVLIAVVVIPLLLVAQALTPVGDWLSPPVLWAIEPQLLVGSHWLLTVGWLWFDRYLVLWCSSIDCDWFIFLRWPLVWPGSCSVDHSSCYYCWFAL